MAAVEAKWYVIRAVTGTEKKVQSAIESEVANSPHLKGKVIRVLIPVEKVLQIRSGKKVFKEKPLFPGYVLIEAIMTSEVTHQLLGVPGVLGFVGCKRKIDPPVAVRPEEAARMLGKVDQLIESDAELDISFLVGEEVKVIDGPFNTFTGIIEEVNSEKKRLKVMVKIFGRKTPLELGYLQVEKL
ncbi:MAG: transcription termination/antitermination protein NusG [Bacteroidales bacterium]|nr:transcription termination/antitermination protein NusG [Bacteroidales bacterium]